MKAIRVHKFGDPDVMKLVDALDPRPGENQVTVRIRSAGVNPVEAYMRAGIYAQKPDLPYTPGTDGAGEVISIGPGVTEFDIGDRVFTIGSVSGTYAEIALCRVDQLLPLPDNITYPQGASLGIPYRTAYRALFQKAFAVAGETVLIHGGSGGVGTAAIQLARAAGCRVFATAGTSKGLELVHSLGADQVFNHNQPGYLDNVRNLTEGRGANIVIEMLANVNLANDLTILSPGGRVVIIGSRGQIKIDPRRIMANEIVVTGMLLFHTTSKEANSINTAIITGLSNGTLIPVIGKEYSLHKAPHAHQAVMSPGAYGKIVLLP